MTIALVLSCLIGIVLRALYLEFPITYDEAYNFLSYSHDHWLDAIAKYNLPNHAFFSLTVYWSQLIFGESVFALRLVAFTSGVLIIFMTAALWLQLTRSSSMDPIERQLISLSAAMLAAVSFRLVYYSVESRGYSLQTLLFLSSLIAAERVIAHRSRFWPIAYVITATLAFWTVLIHLYALVSIGIWMIACANRENFRRIIKTQLATAALSAAVYSPIAIYTALLGTKIEGSEPWSALPASVLRKTMDLWITWQQDLSVFGLLWILTGSLLALTLFRAKLGWRLLTLPLALIGGPILTFIITKRPAPFARVWTYLLPILFGYGMAGWTFAIMSLSARFGPRVRYLTVAAAMIVPIGLAANVSRQEITSGLKSAQRYSAELAWQNAIVGLQPGDHIGFNNAFFDILRFWALTKKSEDFKFEPILRRTDGDLVVISQKGRDFGKSDPLDRTRPGRTLLYALRLELVTAMETWLQPYIPAGRRLSSKIIWQDPRSADGFPRLYEFTHEHFKGAD